MPRESILLISCHFSFLLYCLDKQIKSEHAVVSCYLGWAVSTGFFLPLEAPRCCQSLGQGLRNAWLLWAAGGSWTKSLLEVRDLGLTSSVPGGQSPLCPLCAGKTLGAEEAQLAWAHRGALPGLSSPTLGQNLGGCQVRASLQGCTCPSVPRSSLGEAAGGEADRAGPCSRAGVGLSLSLHSEILNSSPLGHRAGQR